MARDPGLERWARERALETQATNSHEAFSFGVRGHDEPIVGAGGIEIVSSDNERGSRTLHLRVRPVILGQIEWYVDVSTQGLKASKPHAKSTYVLTSPAAARELAWKLLAAADAAEEARPRPTLRPVK